MFQCAVIREQNLKIQTTPISIFRVGRHHLALCHISLDGPGVRELGVHGPENLARVNSDGSRARSFPEFKD